MTRKDFGNRAPLLWLVLPLAAGLVTAKIAPESLPVAPLLRLAVMATALALGLSARPRCWAIALGVGLLALGAAYYEVRRDRLPEWDSLPGREARLQLRIDRIFGGQQRPGTLSGLGRIISAEPHLQDLVGQRVQLSMRFDPTVERPTRSTVVAVTGVIEPLPRRPPDADGFETYLVDAGVNFRFSRGRLEAVVSPPGWYALTRDRMRERCASWLGRGLEAHPDLVAPMRAMLLGERHELSDEQTARFLASGTMHLFAISGLHIGVIAVGLQTLLRGARLRRRMAFGVGAVLLWGYVDMIGAPPSAVRAFLMVTCVQAAFVMRAPGNPLAGLALSALLVLVLDPMQLFGAGFQMSYGVVGALLLLGLPLGVHWKERLALWRALPPISWQPWQRTVDTSWRWLLTAVGLGVAATLVGTISGVAFFGLITAGSLLANLVMIPAASGVILAGFLSLLLHAMGLGVVGGIFNHAAALLLAVMQGLLTWLVAVPGIHRPAAFHAPWMAGVSLAGLLTLLVVGYAGGWRPQRGGFWPPVIWLGLVLVLGVKFG